MKFADSKDIKRAQDLGKHSGAVRKDEREISRGKASSMAKAITDKRKILGRLEAIANVWTDTQVIMPFVDKCLQLWPNSIYTQAYIAGTRQGKYMNLMRPNWRGEDINSLSKTVLYQKGIIESESGKTITGYKYENWDPVAIIIFNTSFKYNL
jgi:hypothetical protein